MHWNAIPVIQNPRRTLWLFAGLFAARQAFEILWIVGMRTGFEISSVDGLVRITPVYVIKTAVLLLIMVRLGVLRRGHPPCITACRPRWMLAACTVVVTVQVPAIVRNQADYVYFQFDDYAAFLALGGLRMVFLDPLMQEILFRGLLYEALRNRGRLPAYIISTAVYVATHVPFVALLVAGGSMLSMHTAVSLAVTGLTCAWVFHRTGRLFAPVVVHMTAAASTWYAPAARYGLLLLQGGSL